MADKYISQITPLGSSETYKLKAYLLKNGRTFKVQLDSTDASTAFDGSANITDIGVTGVLPIANGGTGANSRVNAYKALAYAGEFTGDIDATNNEAGIWGLGADNSYTGESLKTDLGITTLPNWSIFYQLPYVNTQLIFDGNPGQIYIRNREGSSSSLAWKTWKVLKQKPDNAGHADTAAALSPAGTTAQFWRGDNTWSNELSGGQLKITNYSNTVTIGSGNANYMHFNNSADIPFYFNKSIWVDGDLYPYGASNTRSLGSSSKRWKSLLIGTADSYGGITKPIYWKDGVPTALSETVGATDKPVFLSSGTITASTSTIGSGIIPIYMTSGQIKASTSTVGTATKPIWMDGGTIKAGTYELKATVNASENANRAAYYSTVDTIEDAGSIYMTASTLGINQTSITSGQTFEVTGKAHIANTTANNGTTATPPAFSVGTLTGTNIGISPTGIQAKNNATTSTLHLNYYGGPIILGQPSTPANTTINGILTIDRRNYTYTTDNRGTLINLINMRYNNAGGSKYYEKTILAAIATNETDTTVDGASIFLGSQGGALVLGAGESPATAQKNNDLNSNKENIYLIADGGMLFYTNADNAKHKITIDSNGLTIEESYLRMRPYSATYNVAAANSFGSIFFNHDRENYPADTFITENPIRAATFIVKHDHLIGVAPTANKLVEGIKWTDNNNVLMSRIYSYKWKNNATHHGLYFNMKSAESTSTADLLSLHADDSISDIYYISISKRINTSLNISATAGYTSNGANGAGSTLQNNGILYLNNTAGSWAFIRLNNSSNLWDIATKSNDLNGALQFRPAGTATDAIIMSTTGNIIASSVASSWIDGQRYERGGLNLRNATNTSSYWPWIRQTNTGSSKWFSMGVLNNSLYIIGSATSRTANGVDHEWRFDVSDGYLYGNFSGSLNGNASTATAFSSNATVTLTGDTTGTSAGSTKSWSVPTVTSALTVKGGRVATADSAHAAADYSKMYLRIATDSMTTNKPKFSIEGEVAAVHDGHILEFHWDNSGAYNTQLALSNSKPAISIRAQPNGTWSAWTPVLTSINTDWVAWGAGTTAGPTAKLNIGGTTITSAAIPSASTSASGIVTTGAQQFKGRKKFGYLELYGEDAGTAKRYLDIVGRNNAGTQVAEIYYDFGNATNITTGVWNFRQWSPNSTANTATSGGYETYSLPTVTAGLSSGNHGYSILTTKNHAAPSKGTATRIAYYSAEGTISSASNVQYIPTQNAELGTTKGSVNGLFIYGATYGNDTNNLGSATINVFRYGDPGPQIRFSTGLGTANAGAAESSAIIWSDHSSSIGTDQSFNFVGQNNTSHAASNVGIVTNTFIGKTRISAGVNYANTNYVLFSNGTSGINGQLYLQGASVSRDTAPSSNDNRVLYFTDAARNDQSHIYFRHNTAGQHLMYLNTYSSGTKATRDQIVLISDTDTTDPHYIQINSRISTGLNISGTRGFAYNKTDTPGVCISNAGRIYITANSNTVTIGSQNASYTHIYNSANIPFIVNKSLLTVAGDLGNGDYPWNNIYLGNSAGTANADIVLHSSKANNTMIRFLVNTSNGDGQGIRIGGGGLTIIGGGESAATVQSGAGFASDSEQMLVANDSSIKFYPNQQSGYTASALIEMTAGRIWAGVNGDTTRENQIGVQSGAGQLYMYSAASTTGAKGIYFAAHGDSPAGYIAHVDSAHRVYYNSNFTSQRVKLIASQSSQINSGVWLRTCIVQSYQNYANFQIRLTGGWSTGSPTVATIDVNMRNGLASMKLVHRGFLGVIGKVKLVKLETNTAYLDVYIREASKNTDYFGQFIGNVTVTQNDNTTHGTTNVTTTDVDGLATLDLTAGVGNASTPVYIGADGKPAACTAYGSATAATSNAVKTTLMTNASTAIYVLGATGTTADTSATVYKGYRTSTVKVYFRGDTGVLMGAAWNDYAEYRQAKDDIKIEPGRVVKEVGDETLELTTERLQRGCSIVSNTFGISIGESETNNLPLAVAGRVLAYPYENREDFKNHIGWPVCSGPNGTVSIMTEEEEIKYPSRIIGTISAVPDYEIWHGGADVIVDGRVWIKVR